MSIAVPLRGFGASGGTGGTLTVTAPANVTVTVSKGSKSKTKTSGASGVVVFKGLEAGTWTVTITGDGKTAQKTVTITTDYSAAISFNTVPEFTYTGDFEIVNDSDEVITVSQDNWKIRFLTSGTLTFTSLNGADGGIDVFLVGGGGGTKWSVGSNVYGGGAGGGYTQTGKAVTVTTNTPYTIDIGAGGIGAADGGATSAFGLSASGGGHPTGASGAAGGSGGGGYVHASSSGTSATGAGNGGSDGGNGVAGGYGDVNGGTGQGTTTREFGETGGKLYAGGGAGSSNKSGVSPVGGAGGGGDVESDGAANTGGGAGNAINGTHNGGSGIAVIRNTRGAA